MNLQDSAIRNGILETAALKGGNVPDGYYLVDAENSDGSQDKFYFNYDGYKRPAGDLGNNWFWSSPVVSGDSGLGYVLYGYGGVVHDSYRGGGGAVRCVVGQ